MTITAAEQRLRDELLEQRELWKLAAVILNAIDDRSNQVRFMDFHRPIQRIDTILLFPVAGTNPAPKN